MGDKERPLQLIIEKEWAADSITALGSGYQFHLAYNVEQIEPVVLENLRQGAIALGYPMELAHTRGEKLIRIAIAELIGWVEPANMVRFDFRILQVVPYLRDGADQNKLPYFCRYKRRS